MEKRRVSRREERKRERECGNEYLGLSHVTECTNCVYVIPCIFLEISH